MFESPQRESVFIFFAAWALASLLMIIYAVGVERAPLHESVNILVPLAVSLVLDA